MGSNHLGALRTLASILGAVVRTLASYTKNLGSNLGRVTFIFFSQYRLICNGEFHWANRSKWSEQPEQHTGVTGTCALVPRMKHSRCSGSRKKRGRARCQGSCDQTFPALASRSISRARVVRAQLFRTSFARYVPVVLCLPSAWRRMKKSSGCKFTQRHKLTQRQIVVVVAAAV